MEVLCPLNDYPLAPDSKATSVDIAIVEDLHYCVDVDAGWTETDSRRLRSDPLQPFGVDL
jgi:hypothetical protein